MPRITFIMLTWNALKHTKFTLKSLFETTKNFDLIIFDNGSRSDTVDFLESFAKDKDHVKLIKSPENVGCWKGRYMATQEAKTDLVCFIDNDVAFEIGWLDKLLPYFEDPKVAAVSPLKLLVNLNHPVTGTPMPYAWRNSEKTSMDLQEQLNHFLGGDTFSEFRKKLLEKNSQFIAGELKCPPDCLSSCCEIVRGDIFLREDVSDANFAQGKYGFEDMDYSWTFYKLGYKVILSDKAYIHHFEHSSVEDNNHEINAPSEQQNTLYFYYKWEKTIVDWATKEIEKGVSPETLGKHFLFRVMTKTIPDKVPSSIQNFIEMYGLAIEQY